MAVESASDRAVFVNSDDFGASAVYTPAGGAASDPFNGVFDRPSMAVEMNEASTIDARPTFWCREDDLPNDAEGDDGDTLAVSGEGTFTVFSIETDGQGFALLRLGASS